MSIKDYNKVIIVSDALTGDIVFQIDYDDFINVAGQDYLDFKINNLILSEHGALVKVGFKK